LASNGDEPEASSASTAALIVKYLIGFTQRSRSIPVSFNSKTVASLSMPQ
jgi:hypothetical protein